jgi:DNA-binding HxlR family transcriptional regulator
MQDILKALSTSHTDEVLFYLSDGEHRYSEIMRDLRISSSNTLCRSLRKLEDCGLVEQCEIKYDGMPSSGVCVRYTVYRLTKDGVDLSTRLKEYRNYGKKMGA